MASFSKELSFVDQILTKMGNPTPEIAMDAIRNFPKTNDFLEL